MYNKYKKNEKYQNVKNIFSLQGELRCTTADSSSIDLLTLEVCEEARGLVATEGVVQDSILAPAVAGGAAAVLLLLLLLLVVLYRAQFKLWLYSRYIDLSIYLSIYLSFYLSIYLYVGVCSLD